MRTITQTHNVIIQGKIQFTKFAELLLEQNPSFSVANFPIIYAYHHKLKQHQLSDIAQNN